jgi:hypothetical protein
MFFGDLAIIFSSLFTGAAFYVGFAEQPARLKLQASQLLTQWIPSYKRGFMMQSSLAIFSGASGLFAFYQSSDWRWIVGAIFIFANWPFTILVIMPTNKNITATPIEQAGPETIQEIVRWGFLHSVRTGLGACSTILYLWALQR